MFRIEYLPYVIVMVAIPIFGLLMYWAWMNRKRRMQKLGDVSIIQQLIPGYSDRLYWRNNLFILLGVFLLVIAGINPQWGTKRENVKSTSSDIFIALDISNSMLAQDIAPSRMERAKRFSQELIKALRGNRIGLVYFAGGGYIQMPLTNDYAAAQLMVKSASPTQAGTQGTDIGEAINIAEDGFQKEKNNQRALIIITDGENHDQHAIDLAEQAKEEGCFIYTVGVGTENGAPIPVEVNGRIAYKKDDAGNPITTKLNVDLINDIAISGGGKPFLINQGKEAIRRIVEDIDKLEKREVQQQSFSVYNSYFQYFLFPGMLFILLGLFMPKLKKEEIA